MLATAVDGETCHICGNKFLPGEEVCICSTKVSCLNSDECMARFRKLHGVLAVDWHAPLERLSELTRKILELEDKPSASVPAQS